MKGKTMGLYPDPVTFQVDTDRGGSYESPEAFAVHIAPGPLTAGTTATITVYGPAALPTGISVSSVAKRNASLAWVIKSS